MTIHNPPLCTDCIHYRSGEVPHWGHYCMHSSVSNVVDGEPKARCDEQRQNRSRFIALILNRCGRDGSRFETNMEKQ